MPMLSELPSDSTRRDAVLDSSLVTAGPEQRQGLTETERKVETTAATAAAILGSMLSSTKSTTMGAAGQFDETRSAGPRPAPTDAPRAEEPGQSNADLIPWIR